MKLKLLLISFFITSIGLFAQTEYPLKTIMDIQMLPDSVISQGDHASLINGDTVRVQGVLLVAPVVSPVGDRRRIIASGGRWTAYIQDTSGNVWGGINVIQHDTTGDNKNTFWDLADTAQIVEVTGVVEEFSGNTTQLAVLLNPVTPVQIIGQLAKRPDPIELSITDFMENKQLKPEGEKYEGMYVIIRNVTTSDRNTSNGTFRFNDENGNSMMMYDQSGYFTLRGHRLIGKTDYQVPNDGTTLTFIRGILHTRTDGYYIVPLYPGDIFIEKFPPTITGLTRNTPLAAPNQDVTVSAKIKDADGFIKEARLKYRVNNGLLQEVEMTKDAQDTTLYSAVIPGVTDSALVDYFLTAVDNEDREVKAPSDTARNRYFYYVLNRPVTINDVQYSPFGGGFSAFNNFEVTVTGVVTADTSDIPGDGGSQGPRVYIQNGAGPWSGIQLFGTEPLKLKRGDQVTVTGIVKESFSVTRLDSISQIVIESGHVVPDPVEISTEEIKNLSDGNISAEKWESVLIKYKDVTVTDDNADGASGTTSNFGEILISDKSVENFKPTRVELQDGSHYWHNLWDSSFVPLSSVRRLYEGDKFSEITGVLYFSFSNYKLVPRTNEDFGTYTPVSVNDQNDEKPKSYKLSQNYPNPFNPATIIEYSIPEQGNVTIKIFNLLGQEIKTLVNKFQNSGVYKVSFNASDMATGIYLYQIKVNQFTQTKKMVLMK